MESEKRLTIQTNAQLAQLLDLKHIYGYRSTPNIFHSVIDLSKKGTQGYTRYLYVAGNSVIIYSSELSDQKIITATEGSSYISCVTVSKSGKFIAIAEETKEVGIITIYELKGTKDFKIKKRRTLLSKDCNTLCYEHIIFMPKDERYLISVTKENPIKMLLWDWERSRIKEITDITGLLKVKGIFFTSNDANLLYVYGYQYSKNFPIRTFAVKPENDTNTINQKFEFIKCFIKDYDKNLSCHLIVSDYYTIIGTKKGELLLLNKMNEIKIKIIDSSLEDCPIYNITNYKEGFIVNNNEAKLTYFEKSSKDIKVPFIRSNLEIETKAYMNEKIINLSRINEDQVVIGTEQGQLLSLTQETNKNKVGEFQIKDLKYMNHIGEVVDIAVCRRKPFFATAGVDKTIKIWNYSENTLEYNRSFDKVVNSMSFHPSGLHLAASFKDKVRIINITIDELEIVRDINIRDSRKIEFSEGGKYLAIANETVIQLYNFYTGEILSSNVLKGHDNPVNNLIWASNDLTLYSSAIDGTIHEWNIAKGVYEKLQGYIQPFNSLSISMEFTEPENYVIYNNLQDDIFVNIQRKVEFKEQKIHLDKSSKNGIDNETRIIKVGEKVSSVVLSNSRKYLFIGLGDNKDNQLELSYKGGLRVVKFPELNEQFEINCNLYGIKKMAINDMDTHLFTIGYDNVVNIFEINDKGYKLARENAGGGISLSEELLYDENLLKKKIHELKLLESEVKENERSNEARLQLDNKNREDEIHNLEDKLYKLEDNRKQKVEAFHIETEQIKEEYQKKKNDLSNEKENRIMLLNEKQKKKIEMEKIKFENIKKDNKILSIEFNEQIKNVKAMYNDKIQEIEEKYEQILQELDEDILQEQKELENLKENTQREIENMEEDLDKEIEQVKADYDEEKTKLLLDKNNKEYEVSVNKVEYNAKEIEKKEQERKMQDIDEEITHISQEIEQLKKEYQNNDIEIVEKRKTIDQKIERIEHLNRKRQELDKFKFVLDYKIKELKKEKGPREEELSKMKQQLLNMDSEIEQFIKNNNSLKMTVNEFNLKLQGMGNQLRENREDIEKKKIFLMNFRNELSALKYDYLGNYKDCKKKLMHIYNTYVLDEQKIASQNVDKKKLYVEQRAYLESCIKTLKEKFTKNISVHKNDHKRIMKENVDLVSAINELKKEKKLKNDNLSRIDQLKDDCENEIEMCLRIQRNRQFISELKNKIMQAKKKEKND